MRLEGLDKVGKRHAIGNRTRNLPACSIVPQLTCVCFTNLFCTSEGLWHDVKKCSLVPGSAWALSHIST
jgi:hypothetical protein